MSALCFHLRSSSIGLICGGGGYTQSRACVRGIGGLWEEKYCTFCLNFENSTTCVLMFKADLLIFRYLQGTNIPNFACYGERVNHKYGTRRNKTTLCIPRVRTEAAKKVLLVPQLSLL